MDTCLQAYKGLAAEAHAAGKGNAWRCRPKFHLTQHLLHDFCVPSKLSCNMFSCYRNESFMGLIRGLLRHGHKATLAQKALERFSLLVVISNWKPSELDELAGVCE